MARSKRTELLKTRAFLNRLEETIGSLPTEAEKEEVRAKIATLVDYLNSVNKALQSLPSQESANGLNKTIESLQALITKAQENPVLSGLAPRRRGTARKRTRVTTEEDMAIAKADVESFQPLPVDEIRSRLLNDRMCSMGRLRAIAAALSIATTDKMTRESLAHQVATSIANLKGYKKLGGESVPSTT